MEIREAAMDDAELLFQWRNESLVREQSFDSSELDWESHVHWLNTALANEDMKIVIALQSGLPVGTFRLQRVAESIVIISITVAPSKRGQGIGTELIRRAADVCRSYFGSVLIQAHIKPGNTSSHRAFLKAGYQLSSDALEFLC